MKKYFYILVFDSCCDTMIEETQLQCKVGILGCLPLQILIMHRHDFCTCAIRRQIRQKQ